MAQEEQEERLARKDVEEDEGESEGESEEEAGGDHDVDGSDEEEIQGDDDDNLGVHRSDIQIQEAFNLTVRSSLLVLHMCLHSSRSPQFASDTSPKTGTAAAAEAASLLRLTRRATVEPDQSRVQDSAEQAPRSERVNGCGEEAKGSARSDDSWCDGQGTAEKL